MKNLDILILRNNNIKNIPDYLGDFNQLEYLDMRNNQLMGELPSFLETLPNLKFWYGYDDPEAYYTSFSGNYLTGTVPTALKNKLGEEAFYNNLFRRRS